MNDELSPRERDDMRDLVLAGTQRIKPAGRHRPQLVAGAIALVLIGGVTGGAIATASLLPDSKPAPIATTPDAVDPTPTPTPTAAPDLTPTVAFDGNCANTLSDESVAAAVGVPMARSDFRWTPGDLEVLGAIDCLWLTTEVYAGATVSLVVYPTESVPASVRDFVAEGCDAYGESAYCVSLDDSGGTWIRVTVNGAADQIAFEDSETLLTEAAARLAAYPTPGTVPLQPDWWSPLDCAALAAGIDPAVYGYGRVGPVADIERCELHFRPADEAEYGGTVVQVETVPGGAAFNTAAAAPGAREVQVVGSSSAVIVPGRDRYEGSPAAIVVSDGPNVLIVTPDYVGPAESTVVSGDDPAAAIPLTEAILALLAH